MKGINDPSMPEACSKRQVSLYPTDWEEPLPGTMEEIKISIVNDRATGCKREREEFTQDIPCAKRTFHTAYTCSTPKSASTRSWATQSKLEEHPKFPALHSKVENPGQEEWDDLLLEPSDNEDDYELCLTSEQEDTLLRDDNDEDDDSCCAAEPAQIFTKLTNCVITFTPSESENESENGGDTPCKTLAVSDPSSEETECEGDLSNYAAMPPSPCPSAIEPAEVAKSNQPSICNVKSPHEFLTAVTNRDLPAPLSDLNEVSTLLLPDSCPPELPLQLPLSLSRVDDAEEWSEDPDLAFDRDIDNLMATSPNDASSVDEYNGVQLASITTKSNSEVISGSKSPQVLEAEQVLTAHAACSSTLDVAQDLSPLSLNTPGLPKDHHHHHHHPVEAEPLTEALPSIVSSIVFGEPKLDPESSIPDQNVESHMPLEAEGTNGMPKMESTSSPTDPPRSAAPSADSSQSKIVVPSHSNTPGPEKEKPQVAVAALPRKSFRDFLLDSELETEKDNYFNRVWMHIEAQGQCNIEDPLYEMASLSNQISREDRSWLHPSDYTRRNYLRLGRRPSKRFTLNQWVTKNGGPAERFKNFPATFQRSPIPSALPFSSS